MSSFAFSALVFTALSYHYLLISVLCVECLFKEGERSYAQSLFMHFLF